MEAERQKAILKMERKGLIRRVIVIAAVLFVLFGIVFGVTTVNGEDI